MPEPLPCFECDPGMLRPAHIDYEFYNSSVGKILVPEVPMFKCDCCGDVVIGDEGNIFIEAHVNGILGPNRIYRRKIARGVD